MSSLPLLKPLFVHLIYPECSCICITAVCSCCFYIEFSDQREKLCCPTHLKQVKVNLFNAGAKLCDYWFSGADAFTSEERIHASGTWNKFLVKLMQFSRSNPSLNSVGYSNVKHHLRKLQVKWDSSSEPHFT